MEPDDQVPPKSVPAEGGQPAANNLEVQSPAVEPVEEDITTDKAVDEIVKKEGDEVLQAQDEAAEKSVVMKQTRWERLKNFAAQWWANPKKRWGTIAGLVVLIAVLLVVPFTGANILGFVLKKDVTVQAVDSKTGAPVSGATVELAGVKAQTEANGKATVHVHAGSKKLVVSKKYYRGYNHTELVSLSSKHNTFKASLVALGRQVQVKVVNKLTVQPVAGVTVSASGANAKTDKKGMATLVIPSGADTTAGSLSLNGYNTAKISLTASGDLAKNTFGITPSGKLYFLSNLSGKIDVVKTNLDGTDRQTVLAGTGNEDRYTTSLLASRDWKYLALLSKRSGDKATIYLIDTTNNDKLTTVDQGNADFSLVGWSGDRFIYQVTRNTVSDWQPNQQALKSLDATTGQTLLLDQTQGSGSNANDFIKQQFGSPYIIGNQVVYAKNWNTPYYNTAGLNGKQAELDAIGADGSGHKTVKTFTPTATNQTFIGITPQLYEPGALYIAFSDGGSYSFYTYEDGKIAADSSMTSERFFNTPYGTYLLSPSGNQTFWADQRDGKNTLFVGDQDGKNQKQIASLSDYNTYGWYTDNLLLVSKNSSELYAMSPSGGTAFKITDYYKPAVNYNGYGGGYGGL